MLRSSFAKEAVQYSIDTVVLHFFMDVFLLAPTVSKRCVFHSLTSVFKNITALQMNLDITPGRHNNICLKRLIVGLVLRPSTDGIFPASLQCPASDSNALRPGR